MANLYYREDLPASAFEAGAVVEIAGDEARHAVRVARLRVGERTLVGDGGGTLGRGEVVAADRDRFAVRLEEVRREPAPALRLVLVQALAKGDRDERAVEQATEFGVDAIVPWEAGRSVSRWGGAGGTSGSGRGEKAERGVAKWRRIAREASKQSLRARVPEVRDPVALPGLCALAGRSDAELLVLHPGGEAPLSAWARVSAAGEAAAAAAGAAGLAGRSEIAVVVGPEGGLGDDELAALAAAGARVLRLGETVLRTSSAGPAALAVLNAALGRW